MVEQPDIEAIRDTLQLILRTVNDRHKEVMEKLDVAAEERQAIRDVIDNQLAGQKQVNEHERRIKALESTRF